MLHTSFLPFVLLRIRFIYYTSIYLRTGFQHDFNITCYSFSLPVIWKVPLVEQEEPELNPCVVIWIRVAKSLAFLCRVLTFNICIFVLLETIEQPVLLVY